MVADEHGGGAPRGGEARREQGQGSRGPGSGHAARGGAGRAGGAGRSAGAGRAPEAGRGASYGSRDGDRASRPVARTPRLPEPRIEEGVTGKELDRGVWTQLRTLTKENAEGVAQHLVMAALLMEDDIDAAKAHAETAVRRAGRVPAAREALGLVAYRMGDWAKALSEFRTVRRLSGSSHLLPLMVDAERGLGRHEKALDLAQSPEAATLARDERVELAIVVSGIRRDLGQLDAAASGLRIAELTPKPVRPWTARLAYAYAEAVLALGEVGEARRWFAVAVDTDADLETDASERLDELDGISQTDLLGDDPDGEAAEDDGRRAPEATVEGRS